MDARTRMTLQIKEQLESVNEEGWKGAREWESVLADRSHAAIV